MKTIKRLTDWFGLHPMAGDTIGAAFLALLSLTSNMSMLTSEPIDEGYFGLFPDTAVNRFLMVVWSLAYAVPFIWRRTRPAFACTLLVLPHLVQLFVMPNMMFTNFYVLLMMFAIAAYGSDRARRLWLLLGVAAAMAAAVDWTVGWAIHTSPEFRERADLTSMTIFSFVATAVSVVASWLLGAFTRERLTTVRTLRDRADAIAAERDRFAQLAAEQERSRIAREMHDVVAHSLSVIVVQTDGAVYALDQPGDDAGKLALARSALERIAATSREALRETRALVGVLREGEAPEMAPQPGLDEICELVASTRASGLGVDYVEKSVEQIIATIETIRDKDYLSQKLLKHFAVSPLAIPKTNLALLHTQSSKVQLSSFKIYELKNPVEALSMNYEKERIKRILVMLTRLDASQEMRDLMTAISQSLIENHLYTEIYKTGNRDIIYQLLNQIFTEKIKKLET